MKRTPRLRPHDRADAFFERLFFCPSCANWRTSKPLQSSLRHDQRRHASILSSNTAVNATKIVPERYKGLYDALSAIQKKAPAQVNLSRLRLALQGLESETPTTRVAILGLNVQETARRLVRLLLADALEDEAQWEQQLLNESLDFSRGLVIRYGQSPNANLQQPKTAIPVLHVPSTILEQNHLEVLVSAVSGLTDGAEKHNGPAITPDVFLTPSIGTPTSASGRQVAIAQPVHSTLLVTQDLEGLVLAAELLASTNFAASEDRRSIRIAVDLDNAKQRAPGDIFVVNIPKAEEGLAAIRRSVSEATTYEHKFVGSGVPVLYDWLQTISALQPEAKIPPPLQTLIMSILANATKSIQSEAAADAARSAASSLGLATRTNLEAAIDEFSRNSHQELQSGLASAWSSRNWRKLAWYKLFWRVDDVGLIITDLVTNAWLPRTERAVYELSGRLSQAGISPLSPMDIAPNAEALTVGTQAVAAPAPVLQAQASIVTDPPVEPVLVTSATGVTEVKMTPINRPMPLSSTISNARTQHLVAAIGDLTSTAQQIVLKTLTISGLSGGLSLLTYLSITPGSMYEAATIFAVGTVFALWRMQGDWLRATRALEEGLLDSGRELIKRITQRMRQLVEDSARARVDELEARARKEAVDALARARAELEKLSK